MKKYSEELKIEDLGEFRFINEVLLPLFGKTNVGDDVAFLSTDFSKLIGSSDAGPSALKVIPESLKYYNEGWLLAIANLSDLASAAAVPLGISNSIDIPKETKVNHCIEFFQGFKDACDHYDLEVTGGNIRERKLFSSHATIFGSLADGQKEIRRRNVKEGDYAILLGEPAGFVLSYLKAQHQQYAALTETEKHLLLKPKAKVNEMIAISQAIDIIAASDVSDGVLGALQNITDASQVGFMLDESWLYTDQIEKYARDNHLDALNLFNFWGDWNMVLVIRPHDYDHLLHIASTQKIPVRKIATAHAATELCLTSGEQTYPLSVVRNENFTGRSFNKSMMSNIDYMLKANMRLT